jgi:hypothetical protein
MKWSGVPNIPQESRPLRAMARFGSAAIERQRADISVAFVAHQKLRYGPQHVLRCNNVKVCCQKSQVAEMKLS